MSKGTAHISEEVLEEYYFRRLEPERAEGTEDHLFWCDSCRKRLEHIEQFSVSLKQAVQPPGSPRVEKPRRFPVWSLGTAIAAMAVLVIVNSQLAGPGRPAFEELTLSVSRGIENSNSARTNARLALVVPVQELSNGAQQYRFEVVTASGASVFESDAAPGQGSLRAELPRPLRPGQYWVRLYSQPGHDLEKEFSLVVNPAAGA